MSKLGMTLSLFFTTLLTTTLVQNGSCREGAGTLKGAEAMTDKTLAAGVWGGDHLRMEVNAGGASLDFDCANGMIERPIVLDAEGRFDIKGTYVLEHPGPIRRDEVPNVRPVRYVGRAQGDALRLTIVAADSEEMLGDYALTHGSAGRVMKCR